MNGLTNHELLSLAKHFRVGNFKGVYCIDQLFHEKIGLDESGIVNLAASTDKGSHWVSYYRKGDERIYFDSYGGITPIQIQRYLKTNAQFKNNKKCIERQTYQIQQYNTVVCGEMSLFVLIKLNEFPPHSYDQVLRCFENGSYLRYLSEIRDVKAKSRVAT